MKKNIISLLNIVLYIVVSLAGYAALDGYLHGQQRDHTVVGTVYAPDALFYMNRTIILVDGQLQVTTCSEYVLDTADRFDYARCFDTSHIGDGIVLVKTVKPEFKQQVRDAMTRSIVYTSLELVDGKVLQ